MSLEGLFKTLSNKKIAFGLKSEFEPEFPEFGLASSIDTMYIKFVDINGLCIVVDNSKLIYSEVIIGTEEFLCTIPMLGSKLYYKNKLVCAFNTNAGLKYKDMLEASLVFDLERLTGTLYDAESLLILRLIV